LIAYICVLFLLATTGLCLQTWISHDAFIAHRTYPGGPFAYLTTQAHRPINLAMTMLYIVLNWFADGMLLYRFYVLFRCSYYVLVGCVTTMLTLIVVGSAFLDDIGKLGTNLWTNAETAPSLAYLSLSLSINVLLTVPIVWRIITVRREIASVLGKRQAEIYTSIVAMLIESASLYTITALVSIIACAAQSPLQNAILPMLGQLQAIPPLLITLRVMEGRAVTPET
ncbi:hypothetical protein BD413DRAFT_441825, partial [Trametes elegans]